MNKQTQALYTPGPWISDRVPIADGVFVFTTAPELRNQGALRVIARCKTVADAQLIAAAPAMLEALRVLLDKAGKFEAGGMAFKHYFGEAVFNAHAAIAKATED